MFTNVENYHNKWPSIHVNENMLYAISLFPFSKFGENKKNHFSNYPWRGFDREEYTYGIRALLIAKSVFKKNQNKMETHHHKYKMPAM